ncbi:hypothetical protein Tsubulata_014008 [Turnera subulata]|uniref:Peptidase A1 domain-containing protein n=1 Tax=Turnera subulata TaxID=218843 RepID=A0A9Q0G1Q4_9ROSI|nr:hypothetical protein Tsubulata_014008 [Turnera subulata]
MMHSSKLNFGGDAALSHNGSVSTPLVSTSDDQEVLYRVTLQGMSVNGHRISLGDNYCSSCHGNMIIDSGNRLTLLPQSFFNFVALAIDSAMQHVSINVPSTDQDMHKYCYDARVFSDVSLPNITVHFKGADLGLKFNNVFVPGDSQDVWCLAFAARLSFCNIWECSTK